MGVGLGRARFSRNSPLATVVETLAVASLAAAAGFVAGTLVSHLVGVEVPAAA